VAPRILLVGGASSPCGLARHLCQLSAVLAPRAEVTLLTEPEEGGLLHLDPRVRRIESATLASRIAPGPLWRACRDLHRHLRQEAADLTWVHGRLAGLIARLLLALRLWRPTAPVLFTYHGLPFDPGQRPLLRRLSLLLEPLLLRACPSLHLVQVSEDLRARFVDALGPGALARHRLHVLENCANLGPLPGAPPRRRRRLLVPARAAWQKNLPLAAELLNHLPPGMILTFCGPGTDSPRFCDQIAARVQAENLGRIECRGPLTDIRPLLARSDAVLLTSRYEGVPLAALEAREVGLPLILSDFAGARELLKDQPFALRLRLRDLPRDGRQIAVLLDQWAEDPAAARHAIQAEWAPRWSEEIFAATVLRLLEEVSVPLAEQALAAE
jgi:glycosyltransferase involved in cell wall biosynthesis